MHQPSSTPYSRSKEALKAYSRGRSTLFSKSYEELTDLNGDVTMAIKVLKGPQRQEYSGFQQALQIVQKGKLQKQKLENQRAKLNLDALKTFVQLPLKVHAAIAAVATFMALFITWVYSSLIAEEKFNCDLSPFWIFSLTLYIVGSLIYILATVYLLYLTSVNQKEIERRMGAI